MKAILRSINNFSCKLKQSNNLKYNISPKIRSNKFKNISGNGNVVIEDALNKNAKDYKIYGNTYQNSTSGKNLYNTNDMKYISGGTIIDEEIMEFSYNNTGGSATRYSEFHTNLSSLITENETYSIICEIIEVSGTGTLRLNSNNAGKNESQFEIPTTDKFENLSPGQILIKQVKSLNSFENATRCVRSNAVFYIGQSGSIKLRMSLIKGTVSENNFSYEPYTGGHPSPNPDYPQEIISCGDRTKNLFDKNNANIINGYIQGSTGKIISSNDDLIAYIKCKPNTQYSFQRMQIRDNKGRFRIGTTQAIPIADMTVENFYYKGNSEYSTNKLDGYTTGANAEYLLFYFSQISGMSQNEIDTVLSSIQIEENSIATSYEPYGYKIPINVKGNNLFKPIPTTSCGITSIVNPDGSITYSGTATNTWANITSHNYIDIEPGTYTFSIDKTLSYRLSIRLYYENGSYDVKMILPGQKSTTFTLNKEAKHYYIYISNSLTVEEEYNETIYVQLEKGNTMTSFKPYYNQTTNIYLDEPLRKIGDYVDYIDFKNGKVVRNISEYKITGNENWLKTYGDNLFNIDRIFNDKPFIVGYGLSNMYIYNSVQSGINNNTLNGEFALQKYVDSSDTGYNLFVKNTSYSNKDLFKTYLQSLYNSNTPVVISYPLETSTEESITLPNINLIEGKNIITLGTDVQGVFETEYYSKEIIDISNYKYNLRKVED